MKLLLVRHAESTANAEHIIACQIPGPPLSELGQQQAHALIERVQEENVVAIYHSRMLRTRLTAQPLADHLGMEMTELEGLHEVDLGDLAERSDQPAYDLLDEIATLWNYKDELDNARPGGETGRNVLERMTADFDRMRREHGSQDGAVIAVAHGLCLRTATQRWADGVPLEFAFRNLLPNTAIIEIDVPADESQRPFIQRWAGINPATAPRDEGGVL